VLRIKNEAVHYRVSEFQGDFFFENPTGKVRKRSISIRGISNPQNRGFVGCLYLNEETGKYLLSDGVFSKIARPAGYEYVQSFEFSNEAKRGEARKMLLDYHGDRGDDETGERSELVRRIRKKAIA